MLPAAVYNNMDAFWGADLPASRTTVPDDGGSSVVHHGGRYKSRSDNVSYEDLLEFSEERQQYRRMQKVLGGHEVRMLAVIGTK